MSWAQETTEALQAALATTEAPAVAAGAVLGDDRASMVEPEVHAKDRFEIGSVTKTMTATLLARMVLDGVTSLDAPVSEWLDAGDNGLITLGELATHVSGLPRMAPNAHSHEGYSDDDPYAAFDAALAEEGMRAASLEGRGAYAYSNFGYQLLGVCLERAAGQPLAELFQRHIFDPTGMPGAVVHPDTRALGGHDDDNDPVPNWQIVLPGPGGVNATIADMVAYVAAVAAGPGGPLGDAVELTMQPRADGPGAKVGLGWLLHPAGIACHAGATAGFSSYLAVHRESGRGVAIILSRHVSGEIRQQVALAAVTGRNPVDVVPRPFEGDPAPWREAALAFFADFVARDFESARRRMRAETAESLTVDRLSPVWQSVVTRCGPLGEATVEDLARVGPTIRAVVAATGETGMARMTVGFLDDGQVVGVLLQ